MAEGITIGQFELVVMLIVGLGGGFAGWLYRHETWFRNIVFPVVQVLTGESPRGDELPGEGHLERADDRLTRLENRVEEVQDDVERLSRTQKRHNRQTEGWLRRIFSHIEGVDPDDLDDDEPLFRGGNSSGGSDD